MLSLTPVCRLDHFALLAQHRRVWTAHAVPRI